MVNYWFNINGKIKIVWYNNAGIFLYWNYIDNWEEEVQTTFYRRLQNQLCYDWISFDQTLNSNIIENQHMGWSFLILILSTKDEFNNIRRSV